MLGHFSYCQKKCEIKSPHIEFGSGLKSIFKVVTNLLAVNTPFFEGNMPTGLFMGCSQRESDNLILSEATHWKIKKSHEAWSIKLLTGLSHKFATVADDLGL